MNSKISLNSTSPNLASGTKPIFKYLSIASFIALYSYIIPYGFITTCPCDATLGHDNTIGYILAALFPVLLGLLLYYLFTFQKKICLKKFLKRVALSAGWLLVTLVLWLFVTDMFMNIITKYEIKIPYIYKYGCYNDIELTDLAFYIAWLIVCLITGLVFYLSYHKISKIKLQ